MSIKNSKLPKLNNNYIKYKDKFINFNKDDEFDILRKLLLKINYDNYIRLLPPYEIDCSIENCSKPSICKIKNIKYCWLHNNFNY